MGGGDGRGALGGGRDWTERCWVVWFPASSMFVAGPALAQACFTGVLPLFSLSVISLVNAEVQDVGLRHKMRRCWEFGMKKKEFVPL